MFDIERIDKAIECIADRIASRADTYPETITALAELIKARAVFDKENYTNNFSQIIHETTEDDFPNSVDKLISKIASSIHSKMEKEEIHALAALIEARAKVPGQKRLF